MKLTTRRQRGSRIELSMTSMIDVVFLLLIFFIVTTTFVRPERQIQSAIKVNERASQDQSNLDPAVIDVTRLGTEVMFQIGAIKTNDLSEIKKTLRDFENKSEGAFVRVADNVPFEAAAQAIGACNSSGFPSVSYLPAN